MIDFKQPIVRVATLLAIAAASLGAASPRVGRPAPDFRLTLVDGTKVSLDQLRGNVIVLNFWATWCGPCKQELPILDRYYAIDEKAGLKVFAVTTEGSLPLYRLKALFAQMHIPAVRRVDGPYAAMSGIPTNYIIDRSGIVRYARSGAFDLDALNAILVPLLNEPREAAPDKATG